MIYSQIVFAPNYLIKLDDDTFIAYNFTMLNGAILRLNKNIETKFRSEHEIDIGFENPLKSNLYIVPYSVLKDLEKQTSSEQDYMIQGVHYRLLTYLYNEQEKINGGKNVK